MLAATEGNGSAGRYHLLREIGRGRRAVVVLAEDPILQRQVAVKRALTPADEPLLLEEARRLARVTSPYVVCLLDVVVGPPVGLVLELLHGQTLRARLQERGRASTEETATLVRDLLAALQAVHAAGLVHGDVKPENLWVRDDERLVLLDLGAIGDGTALYAAPEAGFGMAPTVADDLYAAAVVAYESLSGRPPFDATRADELAVRKRTQVAPPVRSAGAAVSAAVESWLARALDAQPDRRFSDAIEASRAWCEAARLSGASRMGRDEAAPPLQPQAWSAATRLLEATADGAGGVVVLQGARGLGKSFVVGGWCGAVRAQGGVAFEVCMPASQRRTPYAAWRAAVRGVVPALGARAAGLLPRPAGSATAETAQQERVVRALQRLDVRGPIGIAADELETCDGATRRLVIRLAREAANLRLAVLVTLDDTAPGRIARATRAALATCGSALQLQPPGSEAWRRFVAAAVGAPDVSDTLVAALQGRTAGNPHLAVLLLEEWRATGVLRQSGDGWVFRPELAGAGLPRGAHPLFERQLAGLAPTDRTLLQLAAVQGARFDPHMAAARAGRPELEVRDALHALARQGILRRDGDAYLFKPPLVAAYLRGTLSPEHLAHEHGALAEALLAAGAIDDAAIGSHLFAAGFVARALPHLETAGRAALARHDAEAALASIDLACTAADASLVSEADAARRLELGLLRTQALQRLAAWEPAAEELENLLVLARAWGHDAAEMRALRAQGEIEYARSHFDEAIARYLEAQLCAARGGAEPELHELALQVGNIHFERGELDAAAAEYDRVLDYAARSGNGEMEARAANNVALIESIQGRKERAVQFFDRSLQRFRALGRVDAVARLDQNIGQIYLELGNWAEARNFFHRAMTESEISGQPALLAAAALDCAEADIRLGAHADAAAAIERALAICHECGDEIGVANAYRLQAAVAAAAGDTAAAEARLQDSIGMLQKLGQALLLGVCWKDLGAVRLQARKPAAAAAALAQARQLFAALEARQHAAEVEALQARCGEETPCPQ